MTPATIRLLPALLWMAVIFAVSSTPKPLGLPGLGPWDKLAHAFAYGVLAVLLAHALYPKSATGWRPVAVVVSLATLYGMSDEFHQLFVPGREASVGDLVADAVGALFGAASYLVCARRVNRLARRTG